jgi:outer membrane receptor protein involved in Fe transport
LFPGISFGGESSMGPGSNDQQAVTNHGPIGTVSADLIKLAGRHTLSFGFMGVEQINSQHNYYQTNLTFNGGFTTGPDPTTGSGFASGNGVAEMLLGAIDSANVGTVFNPLVGNHLLGGYLQDDWKPTRNLTLNAGIRYELQTPYTVRHNTGSVFDPNALNPISFAAGRPYLGALEFLGPGNRDIYNINHDNIAPRLGFSYQPTIRSVIHGGYGNLLLRFDGDSFRVAKLTPPDEHYFAAFHQVQRTITTTRYRQLADNDGFSKVQSAGGPSCRQSPLRRSCRVDPSVKSNRPDRIHIC